MKKLSMATAGAAFIALSVVSMAPAEAATLTRLDYSGSVTLESPLIPLFADKLSSIPGVKVQGKTAQKAVNESITVDNLSGRLSDAGDSELTIPLNYIAGYLNNAFFGLLPDISQGTSLNSFVGKGSIFNSKNKILSGFDFFYNKSSDEFVVNNYNFDKIQSCLSGKCKITGKGNVSASVPWSAIDPNFAFLGSTTVRAGLGFDVVQTATPLPTARIAASRLSAPNVAATGVAVSRLSAPEVTTAEDPTSVPEPTTLLGLIGVGGFFAAKRKKIKAA